MKPGTYVNLHLIDPIERLWGRIQSLDATGITLRGFNVRDVETFKYQFKCEEKSVFPQTSFYPMRRVLRIDMDEPIGSVPSVIEAIVEVTGSTPEEIITLL